MVKIFLVMVYWRYCRMDLVFFVSLKGWRFFYCLSSLLFLLLRCFCCLIFGWVVWRWLLKWWWLVCWWIGLWWWCCFVVCWFWLFFVIWWLFCVIKIGLVKILVSLCRKNFLIFNFWWYWFDVMNWCCWLVIGLVS